MKKYCRECGKKLGLFSVHVDGYSGFCYECGAAKLRQDKIKENLRDTAAVLGAARETDEEEGSEKEG
jgi:hypothetical protein